MSQTSGKQKPECRSPDECTRIKQPVHYFFSMFNLFFAFYFRDSHIKIVTDMVSVFRFHVFNSSSAPSLFSVIIQIQFKQSAGAAKGKRLYDRLFHSSLCIYPSGLFLIFWGNCRLDVLLFSRDGFYLCSLFNITLQIASCKAGTGSARSYTCHEPNSSTTCSQLIIMLCQTHFYIGGPPFGVQFEMNASDWSVSNGRK